MLEMSIMLHITVEVELAAWFVVETRILIAQHLEQNVAHTTKVTGASDKFSSLIFHSKRTHAPIAIVASICH